MFRIATNFCLFGQALLCFTVITQPHKVVYAKELQILHLCVHKILIRTSWKYAQMDLQLELVRLSLETPPPDLEYVSLLLCAACGNSCKTCQEN